MKKRILIFVLLLACFCVKFAHADILNALLEPQKIEKEFLGTREINLKLGFDFSGYADTNKEIGKQSSNRISAGNNFSISAEYYKYVSPYVAFGAGITGQNPRWLEDVSGYFGFVPLYLGIKVRSWPQEPGMFGYVLGHLGYNFFYGDSSFKNDIEIKSGGVYYGFGLGISYGSFIFEALFSFNNGSVRGKASDMTANVEYSKWTISAGYKL